MGKSRTRTPVALNTAFAIAALAPQLPSSPTPLGLPGLVYWYVLYPLHRRVFNRMLRGIANRVRREEYASGPRSRRRSSDVKGLMGVAPCSGPEDSPTNSVSQSSSLIRQKGAVLQFVPQPTLAPPLRFISSARRTCFSKMASSLLESWLN